MKTFILISISFIIGAAISGLIGFIVIMNTYQLTFMGKINDNITTYEMIEKGQSDEVKTIMITSLEWFIKMAEQGNNSVWVFSTEYDEETLLRANKFQQMLAEKAKSKPETTQLKSN